MTLERSKLRISGRTFSSRLVFDTGKFKEGSIVRAAIEASGPSMVTVEVRHVNIFGQNESLLDYLDTDKYKLIPNTAGCYTADEAIRTAHFARDIGMEDWIKVEVVGDRRTLHPDVGATVRATERLVKDGFTVLASTSDDIVTAIQLVDVGSAALIPSPAPVGSGLGIQNGTALEIMRDLIQDVPLILDAGIGTASDAALAMEMGFDAVLVNSGIAEADDSIEMAYALKYAVIAGRLAFNAGRMPKSLYGATS
jgi:thiazole synthase